MKEIIIMSIFALFTAIGCNAQSSEENSIEQTIIGFSKAGDRNDSDELADYLDDNYRIVMNRMFGSSEVSIMPKDVYLEKIKSKEYGGDNRKVSIEAITLNGNTASAKVTFIGTKMTFVSILNLIKEEDHHWKIVSDVPVVKS